MYIQSKVAIQYKVFILTAMTEGAWGKKTDKKLLKETKDRIALSLRVGGRKALESDEQTYATYNFLDSADREQIKRVAEMFYGYQVDREVDECFANIPTVSFQSAMATLQA